MARRSKATAEKRRKEVARKEKQRMKAERRQLRKQGLDPGAVSEETMQTTETAETGSTENPPDGAGNVLGSS